MSIRQAKPPSDRFTRISNLWLRDPRLSWKARGLLAWLTSHATGFRVSEKTIVCAAPDGRDAARTAIGELEAYGYLVRERERGRDGRLGGVTYIICDPWSPRLTVDEPTPENPPLAPASTNTVKPQVATYDGKTNAGKPARIRRPAKQEDQNPEKINENPPLLAVGEPADRKGPGAAPTPAANPEKLSRMAAELLGKLPDHYRRAPTWLRSRLLKKISEALTRHSPPAIADYCAKFVGDPAFGDYEHLRRFDDVLRKLAADIADGTACPGCGHDPRHPFCDAEMEDKGSEVPRIRPARRNRHRLPSPAEDRYPNRPGDVVMPLPERATTRRDARYDMPLGQQMERDNEPAAQEASARARVELTAQGIYAPARHRTGDRGRSPFDH